MIERRWAEMGPVGVAEQARAIDMATHREHHSRARRQVPHLLLRIPADQRLKQVAVAVDQVRAAAGAGTDDIVDLCVLFVNRPTSRIEMAAPVPDAAALAPHL